MEILKWSEIIRDCVLVVATCVGLYLAWIRVSAANRQAEASTRQAELARRDHVAELFNRAVGQLSDEKLEVRLGAIYILQQIAQDFPDLAERVDELLLTYLRENQANYGDSEPPIDVREITQTVVRKWRNLNH